MTEPTIADLLVQSLTQASSSHDHDLLLPAQVTDGLLRAAAWHRISPAVYLRLREQTQDPAIIGPLEHSYRQQLARHLQTLADLKIAGKALDDAGIAWVLIKGPALSACWPRPDMREYRDLDLLVDRRRFADTLAVLAETGAVLLDRNQPMIAKQLRAELSLHLKHGTALDLHWDPVNGAELRNDFRFGTEEMLERRESIKISNTDVPVLDPVDTLLHVGYHTTLSGGHRLLWLMDMRSVSSGDLDRTIVDSRAKAYGVDLPLALALDRTARLFGESTVKRYARGRFPIWRSATRLADRIRPVPSIPGAGGSSRLLYQNVRRSPALSVLPTIRDALRHNSPERDPGWRNPLHQDVKDNTAWRDYLGQVQGPRKP